MKTKRAAALIGMMAIAACSDTPSKPRVIVEPGVPVSDPNEGIRTYSGWKAPEGIIVSPGPTADHLQNVVVGAHNVNFEADPAEIVQVIPSCDIPKPDANTARYLVVGDRKTSHKLMQRTTDVRDLPVKAVMSVSDSQLRAAAKEQAAYFRRKGKRTKYARDRGYLPTGGHIGMQDIVVTDTSRPVVLALANGQGWVSGSSGYNIELAPGASLAAVVVYSDFADAVVAAPAGTPVSFISSERRETKRCHVRIQGRPDKSWTGDAHRKEALKPFWRKFYSRVQQHVGRVPAGNIVSVDRASHVLLGPPPTTYETRVPYRWMADKTLYVMANDHVGYGTYEDNKRAATVLLDAAFELEMSRKR